MVLSTLVRMGLSAAAMIALTAVLRALFGKRLPRRAFVALWDACMLRLLLPVFIPWRFAPRALLGGALRRLRLSAANAPAWTALSGEGLRLFRAGTTSPGMDRSVIQGAIQGAWDAAAAVNPRLAPGPLLAEGSQLAPGPHLAEGSQLAMDSSAAASAQPGMSLSLLSHLAPAWQKALLALWLAGAALLLAAVLLRYVRSVRAFSQSLPDGDPRTARFLREHRTLRRVQARVSGAVASPLSYGVLRPVILLPKGMDRESDERLAFVLAHELWHIRAFDALRKVLLLCCVCLHFMNPAAWLLLRLASRDMELLCDERVLASCGPRARRAYALTLLDMEERRMALSPVSSPFSMTAIEERIETMKNRNMKKSAFCALIACLLVCFAVVALATDAPEDGTTYALEDPNPKLSRESWEDTYKKYVPYGLGYDEEAERLTFGGKFVRCFEDMVPLGDSTSAGTVCQFPDGEVDVYAVRDYSAPIERNEDGSYDPFAASPLIGLRAATQEEFDETTRALDEMRARYEAAGGMASIDIVYEGGGVTAVAGDSVAFSVSSVTDAAGIADVASVADAADAVRITYVTDTEVVVTAEAMQGADVPAQEGDGARAGTWLFSVSDGETLAADVDQTYIVTHDEPATLTFRSPDIVWWTEEEYRAWMEEQRVAMDELVEQGGAMGYTQQKGWFTWTREEADEAMAVYESTLELIKSGAKVSKTVDGSGDIVIVRGAKER